MRVEVAIFLEADRATLGPWIGYLNFLEITRQSFSLRVLVDGGNYAAHPSTLRDVP